MAKKNNPKEFPEKSFLVRSKDEMAAFCDEQIKKGKDIIEMPVRIEFGNDFYGKSEILINENEADGFFTAKRKWVLYVKEFLKQSFDHPDNEYLEEFSESGIPMVIVSGGDEVKEERDELKSKVQYLEALKEMLQIIPTAAIKENTPSARLQTTNSKKVFIVHGHNHALRNEVELLVKQLDFEPIVLFKEPNLGDTVIEKLFRKMGDASFAIVLYTKCDEGKAVEEGCLKPRARQNVVFEHGLMCGLLGRKHVVALVEDGVEIPSDLSGVVYIRIDEAKRWQFDVAREMKAAGLDVDLNKLL
jgi:predicted nucleotide-binding protein